MFSEIAIESLSFNPFTKIGQEDFTKLYPMIFTEFLLANGD